MEGIQDYYSNERLTRKTLCYAKFCFIGKSYCKEYGLLKENDIKLLLADSI